MYTATVEAELHDGGTLRARFRFQDKDEACDSADEFIRLNEPIIASAATSVTTNINGRFDNTVMEDFADMIYERHSSEDDGWTQDEIDTAIREHEGTLFHSFIGPVVDEIEDFLADEIRTQTPQERLEYLRGELRAERISQGELIELQSLAKYIEPGDVELLEAAGVPEFEEDED
jgi:hypothetical protein